jgi:hypothetical protein
MKKIELCKVSMSHNANETITHLAMPERSIPVLVSCGAGSPDGVMPSADGSDSSATGVRRLSPSLVARLKTDEGRKEIEKAYGPIPKPEWAKLRDMLALVERINAGDGAPILSIDESDKEALLALMEKMSPEGWLRPDKEHGGPEGSLRSATGNASLTITPLGIRPAVSPEKRRAGTAKSLKRAANDGDGSKSFRIHVKVRPPALVLADAFTRGLKKARPVVWWAQKEKKLAPGFYCADIMTALYALLLSGIGNPGGIAVCQRCKAPFIRSKSVQLYCGHPCQVAAGMKRYRMKLKRQAASKLNAAPKSKSNEGGK